MNLFTQLFKNRGPGPAAVPVAPAAPAPAPAPVEPFPAGSKIEGQCSIQEFFPFRGILFVRGLVAKRNKVAPRILVRFRADEPIEVRPSNDPQNPSSDVNFAFQFNLPHPEGLTDEEFNGVGLLFDYGDAWFEELNLTKESIGADAFLHSDASFWKAVQESPKSKVLEIGSRARSGIVRRQLFPADFEYTGFDILAGENVDVVGDAHRMSEVLPHNHFDFAFSVSVWEHLRMPWAVSVELNRVLKIGGLALINTHQSWPYHEGPWDYFRFTDSSWDSLFNADTGFEIVARGMGQKCVMVSSTFFPGLSTSGLEYQNGYLAVRCVVRKISETSLSWPVDIKDANHGLYPH